MENKVRQVLSGVGFYGTLGVCLAVVGICGWILLKDEGPAVQELPVTPQSPVVQAPELPVTAPAVASLEPEPIPEERAEAVPEKAPAMPTLAANDTPVTAEEPRLVVEPLRGEVLAAFSMEELVYSPAMGDWRTHNGVDIAARAGTTVLAASAGTVLTVEDDPLMGTTVVLEHDGGYQTTYANLQAKPNVARGDAVSAGQIIGAVGTTAPAESGAPHLHFAVSRDGKAVDPNEYLKR